MRSRLLWIPPAVLFALALAGGFAGARTDADKSDSAPAGSDAALLRTAKIPTDGPGLIEFFRRRAAEGADKSRLKGLVSQLGDDSFLVREQASAQLVAAGVRAKSLLEDAEKDPDLEVVHRARECLRRIDQGATSGVVAAAARELARRRPSGAAEALLAYLPSAEDEVVAEEVRSALAEIAVRDGKPDPALTAALNDAQPVSRAAAAVALCRAGAAGEMPAVRKLLRDDDPRVRLRVGLALATAREKEAVPVLIDLLARLPAEETGVAEDLLYHLAGDKAPAGDGSAEEQARRGYRDAWKKWWDAEGSKVDAARLAEASKALGYTLVLLLDQGRAMELDATNRPTWTVEGLEFPLDVQWLPGDHLLSAEHNANRVTERDVRNGSVVWEHSIPRPLAAQRLPDGNTFIATPGGLVEVNRAGKVVWDYTRPGGEQIMKAVKLRNGDIAMVTQLGQPHFVLMSRDGKSEKRVFAVNLHTSGGRIDVLPNGNVLVPENGNNRVVEQSGPEGRVVWEVAVDSPVAATRLPNGHTLVTSMNPGRGAVELDRSGKEVWSYKADTRVTRAIRR